MSESPVIPENTIRGDDDEDTALLIDMARMAEQYVRSHKWCIELREGKYADGIGGIIALFLFRVLMRGCVDDEWIWVFVGDIPSAYLAKDNYNSPHAALERYIEGLEEWVTTAKAKKPLDGLIPLAITNPSDEIIGMVASRINSLKDIVLPGMTECEY